MIVFVNNEPRMLRLKDENGKDISFETLIEDSLLMDCYHEIEDDCEDEYLFLQSEDRIQMSEATFEYFKKEFEYLQNDIDETKKINEWLHAHPEEMERIDKEFERSDYQFLQYISHDNIGQLTNQDIWEELFEVKGLNEYSCDKDNQIPKSLLNIRDRERIKSQD